MKDKACARGTRFSAEPPITSARSNPSTPHVHFEDGRSLILPLRWYPRLFPATQAQRDRWEHIGPGIGVHWPAVADDWNAEDQLAGPPCIAFFKQPRPSGKRTFTA
jgi:hypothetical protein